MIQTQSVLNAVLKFEQEIQLVDRGQLHRAISEGNGSLTLLTYSCLTTEKNAETLKADLFGTSFFVKGHIQPRQAGFYGGHNSGGWDNGCSGKLGHYPKRILELVKEIPDLSVKIYTIIVDTEPCRTWGWCREQHEMTRECSKMLERATQSSLLPPNWQVVLWSDLEKRYEGSWSFEECLAWARTRGLHTIRIKEQAKHLTGFTDRYHFPLGIEETAVRQVAAYAWEGMVLEKVLPNAILLQSEKPYKEKDCLYQLRRDKKNPLCIIHPFD